LQKRSRGRFAACNSHWINLTWRVEFLPGSNSRPGRQIITDIWGLVAASSARYSGFWVEMDLHQKIRTLPPSPGVYLYKNADGEVIYVGKANSLRARVRSYFLEGAAENAKTGTLLREAVDLDYIVVDNEKEALALENNLIKQKKPRYNILLRDDKTYPYIKLTISERYPRVFPTRRLRKDGSLYFGHTLRNAGGRRWQYLRNYRRARGHRLSSP